MKLYKTGINMYAPGTYKEDCIFCQKYLDAEFDVIDRTDSWLMVKDNFPVSPGHLLLITTRHSDNFFEIPHLMYPTINTEFCHLLNRAKGYLEENYPKSTGVNVGFNCGKSAGQTVIHTHVHVIPRYEDDCLDPTGGVRNVIPGKGRY